MVAHSANACGDFFSTLGILGSRSRSQAANGQRMPQLDAKLVIPKACTGWLILRGPIAYMCKGPPSKLGGVSQQALYARAGIFRDLQIQTDF